VRRIRTSPKISVAHSEALSKGCIARYNVRRVELKTFTFAGGPQAVSINTVLGMFPKRLVFTMVKNTDFLGSRDSNPYNFRHYDLNNFTMYLNGRFLARASLDMSREYVSQRLRYTVRRHRHSPLELGTPDNSRHVFKRVLHDSVRCYAGSGSVGRSRLTPHKRRYQDRSNICQGTTRGRHLSIVSRV